MDASAFKKPFGTLTNNNKGYLTFIPFRLPPKIKYDESLIAILGEANYQLGILNGLGKLIPNPNLLISPYLKREAVLSSKIEGTQASIMDIYNFEAEGKTDGNSEINRINEVINYIKSLNECLNDISKGKKIDILMIKKAHKILMNNVRGQELTPGEFRTIQNWIGISGTKINDASYIPPPPEQVTELIQSLEGFINNPPGLISVLIQCAMIHYMFEAIHPFSDGNGRIGRLLISLFLIERKLLDQPLLYLSAYIERNKMNYYSLLLDISQNSDWIKWIKFFIRGVIEQSKESILSIQKIMELKKRYEQKLNEEKSTRNMSMLVDYLFSNPIITTTSAERYLRITYRGAKKVIDSLIKNGILEEYGSRQRDKKFIAHEIVSIIGNNT
ncbi:MAG: Fic family protein [Candidatus Nitrosocosmicus sp.]